METHNSNGPVTQVSVTDGAGQPLDGYNLLRRRWEQTWSMMEEHDYDALILAHQGSITEYGYLRYVAEYFTVLRTAYAVIFPDDPPNAYSADAGRHLPGGGSDVTRDCPSRDR